MPNHPLDTGAERQLILKVLQAVVHTVGSVVGKNTEVVLHDLLHPERSVLAIANGHVSGRQVGSPVLAGPQQDKGFSAVFQSQGEASHSEPVLFTDYETRLASGATLRSATAVFRDHCGTPFAGFCVNADVSSLLSARACLDQLLGHSMPAPPAISEQPDMALLMAEIIQSALTTAASGNRTMKKQAKLEAVRQMHERGMFIVKGGIEKAAAALGVSRYTIYNYLDEIKSTAADEMTPTTAHAQPAIKTGTSHE